MQAEPGDLTHFTAVHLINVDRRYCLPLNDLAACLQSQRNAIRNRMAPQHNERIVVRAIQSQIVVPGIAFQPALAFQVTINPACYLSHQLRPFSAGEFTDPSTVLGLRAKLSMTLLARPLVLR